MSSSHRGARRVLLVGALAPPSGGVASHCEELRRALEAHGLAVELIDPRRAVPDGGNGRARLLAALARAQLTSTVVHVHTNGHNRRSWALAAFCALAHAGPRLLTIHSGLAPDYVQSHNYSVRLVCSRFTKVIAVNGAITASLERAGVASERLVACAAFTPAALAFRVAPPGWRQIRRAHPLLLACALAPGPEYGAAVMLDAFVMVRSHHSQAGLVLFGPGTRHPALAAAVRARRLSGAVHHLGELARAQALAVLAGADLFVRPSLADGDSLSVREALALGRPVVASAVGERPPAALTFPSGDAAACAEQIFRAIDRRFPEPPPALDCMPSLLSLYQRLGAPIRGVATGTTLATAW